MADPTSALAVQYVRHIAAQLAELGVPLELWLGRSGLDRAALAREDFVLDLPTFRSLSLDALELSGEPALGLLVGHHLGVQAHGSLGYAAMSSRSVREVLALLQRYLGIRIALISLTVDERPAEVRVVLTELLPLGDLRAMVLEGVLSTVKTVLDDVSTGACEVRAVCFPFADPGYREQAEELLRSRVQYDAGWAGLVLPRRMLDLRLKMSDPRAFRLAEDLCQRQLLALEQSRSWVARVQRVLLETRVGFPSLDETARRLHVTPRTLHRRLVAEGSSFRAVLDALRLQGAVEQLTAGHASIQEVAYILGYSDPANFGRAFRRWTGMSPSRYREEHGRR